MGFWCSLSKAWLLSIFIWNEILSLGLIYWVLELNHLGRYQLNILFCTLSWVLKVNSAYVFLTWVLEDFTAKTMIITGVMCFPSTVQNTSGHSHVGFAVLKLLFQTGSVVKNLLLLSSIRCCGLLLPHHKYSLDLPSCEWWLSSIGLWPSISWELAPQYQFREVSGFCG